MMGNDHIAANVACAYTVSNLVLCAKADGLALVSGVGDPAGLVAIATTDAVGVHLVAACLGAFAFVVGSLLPDIDSPTSILGRLLPSLPLEHRGITHTIWAAGVLGLVWFATWAASGTWACVFQALLGGLFLGYVGHLFWDSFSRAGVAWLYPVTGYATFGSGARVKRRHYVWLYRTGQLSETVVVGVLVALCFVTAAAAWLFMPSILTKVPGLAVDDIATHVSWLRDIGDRLVMILAGPFTMTGVL